MNTTNNTTPQLALRAKKWRFNPLTNLQPETLARHLDAFDAGHLREAALIWDALELRDDLLRGVISKRKKAVARHGWTVQPKEDLDAAERALAEEHVAALSHFYSNLQCEHAVDTSERGGFKLLARQMMDAVGKRFAVHEVVWKECPASDTNRNFVTAKFRFVPLSFFENITGELRFLEKEGASEGRPLEPGAWMVTVGEGLMAASSTAWMFKQLSLNDWLSCSLRNGTPAVLGITPAAAGSPEHQALQSAVEDVLATRSAIISSSDRIESLNLMAGGAIPFPQLVERVDRMLAALWRGADLSTISRDRGYGASLQEKETCALEEDDAEMLTETFRRYVDAWVIRHVFGEGVRPLAEMRVLVSPRECTADDLKVDEFLLRHGAPLSLEKTLNRYGRVLPKSGERILLGRAQSQASLPESSQKSGMAMDNVAFGLGPGVSFRGCSPYLIKDQSSEGHLNSEGRAPGVPNPDGTARNDSVEPESPQSSEVTETNTTLPNQFTLLQEDWVQLSPYGDFPHARGIQRVNRAAAEAMVAQFHSFRGRLGRLFGGLPFYVGHPDLPNSSETIDRKAYGWIMSIEAREDGLFGQVKWSDAGLELLRNAHFKYLSPYWEAREIANENGRRVYQPVALLSAGLTNQPNIPVRPLANSADSEGRARREAPVSDPYWRPQVPNQDGALDHHNAEPVRPTPEKNAIVGDDVRSRSSEVIVNDTAERNNSETSEASTAFPLPSEGRGLGEGCSPQPLPNSHTIPVAPRQMHTVSCTENLGTRRGELVRLQNRRDRIQENVLRKLRLGMNYDEAWESVKRDHAAWFDQ